MEQIIISNPISLGFWFTIGAILAGLAITAILFMVALAITLLFG